MKQKMKKISVNRPIRDLLLRQWETLVITNKSCQYLGVVYCYPPVTKEELINQWRERYDSVKDLQIGFWDRCRYLTKSRFNLLTIFTTITGAVLLGITDNYWFLLIIFFAPFLTKGERKRR